MSQENLAYYQRIVCIGLRRMTRDSALIRSGFLYWCEKYSHKEFDVAESVTALVSYLGLDGKEKKTLMISFHAATNKLFNELPPVPEVLLKMVEQQSANMADDDSLFLNSDNGEKVIAAKSPQLIVTEGFLNYLAVFFGKYNKEDLAEFRSIVIDEAIPDAKKTIANELVKWASSGFTQLTLPGDISEEECFDIAHKLYMLMSEVIGPVESDKIINHAIDESLKLEAALRFNPKNLL